MSRTYTVRDIIFMDERVNKMEANDRKWFQKYFEELYKARPIEKKSLKAEEYLRELNQETAELLREAGKLRAVVRVQPEKPPPHADKSIDMSVMKPVDPEVANILYHGFPGHEDEARKLYLKERAKVEPKNRFYHQIQTSFQYGWFDTDPELIPAPLYGRTSKPRDEFYQRQGVLLPPPVRSSQYNNYCELFPLI